MQIENGTVMTRRQHRRRSFAVAITFTSLLFNILSSYLVYQLPEAPYYVAGSVIIYLHFATLISILGLTGALRQISNYLFIFSNYLLLDTLLSILTRFTLLTLLRPYTRTLCSSESLRVLYTSGASLPNLLGLPPELSHSHRHEQDQYLQAHSTDILEAAMPGMALGIEGIGAQVRCKRMVGMAYWALMTCVVAATILQLVGSLVVRDFARLLWVEERQRETRGEGQSLPKRGAKC